MEHKLKNVTNKMCDCQAYNNIIIIIIIIIFICSDKNT